MTPLHHRLAPGTTALYNGRPRCFMRDSGVTRHHGRANTQTPQLGRQVECDAGRCAGPRKRVLRSWRRSDERAQQARGAACPRQGRSYRRRALNRCSEVRCAPARTPNLRRRANHEIIVHGQQAFGKSVLEALLERGEDVIGVYCEPESGRSAPGPDQAMRDDARIARLPAQVLPQAGRRRADGLPSAGSVRHGLRHPVRARRRC